MLTQKDTLKNITAAAEKKASSPALRLLILGFFAGLLIALAALASTIASMNLTKNPDTYGLGKLLQGFVFSGGLIMVILGGTELFTGNSLMLIGLLEKKITIKGLLKNWSLVLLGNLLGALFLATVCHFAGIYSAGSGLLGTTLASISATKCSLSFLPALLLGLLCNFLVCLAVFFAFASTSTTGKFLACIVPVTFFVMCGFEHSVANFFYIPAGFFASSTVDFAGFFSNILPVLLGNIIGGGLFVACGFYYAITSASKKS